MSLLVAGLALFFIPHLIPMMSALHERLVSALGENPYKGVYTIVAGAGLVLLVIGFGRAEPEILYTPPAWGRLASMLLMGLAVVLVVAAYVPNNIKRLTAHPMLWGTLCWSVAHLLSNGDQAALVLFGSFALYAVIDMWSATRRGQRPSKEKQPLAKDVTVVVLGLIIYGILFRFHGAIFNVPLM